MIPKINTRQVGSVLSAGPDRQLLLAGLLEIQSGRKSIMWIMVPGKLRKGYGVASGPSADYPYGALERQLPFFRDGGLDLRGLFLGTLNVDISPQIFRLVRPDFTFAGVAWTDLHPPEDFSFARCRLQVFERQLDAWIYYPHPETKLRHFQDPSLMEVISPWISGVQPGTRLAVWVDSDQVALGRRSE
jgi:hypothetical protein